MRSMRVRGCGVRVLRVPGGRGAAPCSNVARAASGLIARPVAGSDLAAVARDLLAHAPSLPNQRLVLETNHWAEPPAFTPAMRTTLQNLADAFAVSICVKSRTETWELDAALHRARQLAGGPLRAMPGMGMHLTMAPIMATRGELRQRLELQCRLQMHQELQQLALAAWDDELSSLPAEAAVPPQFFPLVERIERMAVATDVRAYLDLAAEVLDGQREIADPYFRMLAVCYLAEELGRHESLRPFVRELYAHHFTENFSATTETEQPSLSLLVAASQLRAHVPPAHVRALVERAFGLAERNALDFHGRDARTFAVILEHWRTMGLSVDETVAWIQRFTAREYWVPSGEERLAQLRGTESRDAVEVELDDELVPDEAGARDEVAAAVPTAPPLPWSRAERAFAASRCVQRAMAQRVARNGLTDEVFQWCLQLSSRDPWEETAVAAYDLLSGDARFREQLRDALSHFREPYYRAKAAFVMARRSRTAEADALYAEAMALLPAAALTDLQRAHEDAVMAEVEQREPIVRYLPDLDALESPPEAESVDAIRRWASAQVAAAEQRALQFTTARTAAALQRRPRGAAGIDDARLDDEADVSAAAHADATGETLEARDQRRQQTRRAEWIGVLARSLVRAPVVDTASGANAAEALALLEAHGATRELIALASQLPLSAHPDLRTEVLAAAGRIAARGDGYHAAMLRLLAVDPIAEARRRRPRRDSSHQDDLFRAAVQFLAAAHRDTPGLSNLEVIQDACWLARCVAVDAQLQKSLLTLAKARLKLYEDQRRELRTDHEWPDWAAVEAAAEAGDTAAAMLVRHDEALHALYREGRGHLLASGTARESDGPRFAAAVAALHDPLSQAVAYALRASYWLHRAVADPEVARDPGRHPLAREYMEQAIAALRTVDVSYYQVALGMELFEHLLDLPIFRDFVPHFGAVFQDRFAGVEARHRLVHTRPRHDQAWFTPDSFAQALTAGTLTPALVVRFQTAAQFTKVMRRPLACAVKTQLLAGRMATWPLQSAFELLQPLLAEAEQLGHAALHAQLLDLYRTLLLSERHDIPVWQDFRQRQLQRLRSLGARTEAVPLTSIEWQWIDLAVQKFQGNQLRELIAQPGLVLEDRLRLLRTLAAHGVLDRTILEIYTVLEGRGQGEHFFTIYTALQHAFPRALMPATYVQRLLDDPRVQGDFQQIFTVIDEWQAEWAAFEDAVMPEDRVRRLAANPLLCEQYFGDAATRYRIEDPVFAYQGFAAMVADWAASPDRIDHAVCQTWEAALERAHPTSAAERSAAQAAIASYDELSPEDAAFLQRLIATTNPLTEADIAEIHAVGERSELQERLIGELPPNRQRAYRLACGYAPIISTKIRTPQDRLFLRDVAPTAAPAPVERAFNDVAIRFRQTFRDVAELLTTEWAVQQIERRLHAAQGAEAQAVRAELTALLAAPGSLEAFAVTVRRLHIRLVAAQDGLAPAAARGMIQRERNAWSDRIVIPLLLRERSHLAVAERILAHHLDRPRELHRPLRDFSVDMTRFGALDAHPTPAKQAVATRLGFGPEWPRHARQKTLVELEWLADALQLRSSLRERFYAPLAEQLASFLTQANDPIVFADDADRMYVAHVPKQDIYTSMRIGDFRPCCIASNGTMRHYLRGFHRDRMTQIFALYNPRTGRPIGHMVGHFGFSGKKREPTYFLNGLYIRTQYRSAGRDAAALRALYEFAQLAGCTRIRHGIHRYHDLSTTPPAGYTSVTTHTTKLVSLVNPEGQPVDLYDDLGDMPPNESAETTHYQVIVVASE